MIAGPKNTMCSWNAVWDSKGFSSKFAGLEKGGAIRTVEEKTRDSPPPRNHFLESALISTLPGSCAPIAMRGGETGRSLTAQDFEA
jgi:hypothetical protein